MKLSQLKTIVKEAVKEAIQEEMKDILMEAVRSPKQTVIETRTAAPLKIADTPGPMNPMMQTPMPEDNRMAMRENIQNVLGSMMPGANGTINATTSNVPMSVTPGMDTMSPNGKLPEGSVSMDQIMGLMKK
jgi:hypothetical protein|tara:strand:+ start:166 stop:558 length:393 start_codon:yes stop_codon:yes gene_type:complete